MEPDEYNFYFLCVEDEYLDYEYDLFATPFPTAWNYAVYGSPLNYV